MSTAVYPMIGLMSGTSGDGLDLAYCQYTLDQSWSYEIIKALTIPFPEYLKGKLPNSHRLSSLDLNLLDVDFGQWMGQQVRLFCQKNQIRPLAVASHGHTVFHQPSKGLSLQIGNGWALRTTSNLPVINDFRMLDIQRGGQGAPLVPIGDRLLFSDSDFCINLGGIANISMEHEGQRVAFDCSPFNLLLNSLAEELGASYDDRGNWARSGKVNAELLGQLNQVPFYQLTEAKSLGREDMERDFLPLIKKFEISPQDKLASLVEHYALQISDIIHRYKVVERPRVLITGGGAYNLFFLERLDAHLDGKWIHHPASKELIEFKEALVFGFLGALRIRNEINCLASVTGASEDSCGGVWYS
ncbi:anhydro-N-acetylmuramic acid kinase [Algoriphagus sp.]|uniref:anhydro-N-acetylmuramic acid kinase n=1 Tax=Algoriphagus sp. TaxID=1872435 RepID=UPI002606236F|nr:anhydro-N-acetylmuramic acid kinase [Algoriphagus sp.]